MEIEATVHPLLQWDGEYVGPEMSRVCIKKCPSVALAQIYTRGNLPTCLLRNPLNYSDETDGATLMLLIDCKHWHLGRCLWEMGWILGDKERCWILRGKHVRAHIPTGTACFCLVLPCGYLHGGVKEPQPLNVRNRGDGAQHSQCHHLLQQGVVLRRLWGQRLKVQMVNWQHAETHEFSLK